MVNPELLLVVVVVFVCGAWIVIMHYLNLDEVKSFQRKDKKAVRYKL